jgi:uncharacterized protein YndB with AHSA1/START domain
MSAEPEVALHLVFDVAVTPDHAFATWAGRLGSWWPHAKTVSGFPAALRVEPAVGGRIVETTVEGTEHVWGTVTRWDPPHALGFTWHLFFDPSEATDVLLVFEAHDDGTRITLVQTGFERLGAAGAPRRENTGAAWTALFAAYADVVHAEPDDRGRDAP